MKETTEIKPDPLEEARRGTGPGPTKASTPPPPPPPAHHTAAAAPHEDPEAVRQRNMAAVEANEKLTGQAGAPGGEFPKWLADTTGADRDNRRVHTAAEEAEAKSEGFTRVVSIDAPQAKPRGVEYPRHVHSRNKGYRVVFSEADHKRALAEGWQDKPVSEEEAVFSLPSPDEIVTRIQLLEVKVAALERNQQAPATATGPAQPGPLKKV